MTTLNIESIEDKLFRLVDHTSIIDNILTHSDAEIVKESTLYYTLEHILQLSIQIILDIGTHILAEDFHKNPKNYAEVIIELGKQGIMSKEFAVAQEEMARFRNKLIHDYDSVDRSKTISYGRSAPEIFRTFGQAFTEYIKKQK
ncbi:MAG: HepT-like ribonuclease domain-containing protein [Candidatus Paceibacterota bacterium]|jgi:uncharacterized protein YutE (UPF0331/DUF86 family)